MPREPQQRMPQQRTTISRVAAEAGVSVSTASRVLNRARAPIEISAATAERVRRAAAALGYLPSAAARAMRTGRSRTLGVLGSGPRFFRDVRSEFVGEIMSALVDAAADEGYHLSLLTGLPPDAASDAEGPMADLGLGDGLLVLNRDLARADDPVTASLASWPRPLVYVLDYPAADPEAAVVAPDDEQGGHLATETLLRAGRRGVAFARRDYFANIFDRREAGWRRALAEAGATPGPVWDTDALSSDALRAAVAETGIDAAVCANPAVAERLLLLAREAGVAVPERLAVVRFGHLSPSPDPRIAEVTHDLAGEVRAAVRLLVARIEGDTDAPAPRPRFAYAFRPGDSFPRPAS